MAVQRVRRLVRRLPLGSRPKLSDLLASGHDGAVVLQVGSTRPVLTLSAGVHGDEVLPVLGLLRLVRVLGTSDLAKGIRVVICNLAALRLRQRAVEIDLNRSFPGSLHSDQHEQRLAAALGRLPQTSWHLDLHSTSFPIGRPYGVLPSGDRPALLIPSIADYVKVDEPSFVSVRRGAQAVEVGYERSRSSAAVAYKLAMEAATSAGCFGHRDMPSPVSVRIYEIRGVIERRVLQCASPGLRDFELVRRGEQLGTTPDGRQVFALRDFVPIWMNGPDSIRVADPPTLATVEAHL